MIYTLTMNPALDCYMQTDAWERGQTNRATKQTLSWGGKGVNVAVMLSRLGIPCVALGFVAGFVGEALCDYLKTEGICEHMIDIGTGCTRINVKLFGHGQPETEFNASGPDISPSALQVLFEQIKGLEQGDILVLSGSVPACLPKDIYAQIMQILQGKHIRVVVDAEGEWLLQTLPYHPFLIKPNLCELSALVGEHLTGIDHLDRVQAAARNLQDRGAYHVLVSMGKEGAMLLTGEGACHMVAALGGDAVNTVGAGDAMVAGFLAGLPQGETYALCMGLATGGATAMTIGLATKEEVYALLN